MGNDGGFWPCHLAPAFHYHWLQPMAISMTAAMLQPSPKEKEKESVVATIMIAKQLVLVAKRARVEPN